MRARETMPGNLSVLLDAVLAEPPACGYRATVRSRSRRRKSTSEPADRLFTALRLANLRAFDREFTSFERGDKSTSIDKQARWSRLRQRDRALLDIHWLAVDHALRAVRITRLPARHSATLSRLFEELNAWLDGRSATDAALSNQYYRVARLLDESLSPFLLEQMYAITTSTGSARSVKNCAAVVVGLFLLSKVETDVRPSAYSIDRARALVDNTELDGSVRAFLREAVSNAANFGDRNGEADLVREAKRLLARERRSKRRKSKSPRAAAESRPKNVVDRPRQYTFSASPSGVLCILLPRAVKPRAILYRNGPRLDKVTVNNGVGRVLLAVALGQHDTEVRTAALKRARRALRQTCGADLQLVGARADVAFSRSVYVMDGLFRRFR
jgi:hypothetical protein